MSKRFNFNDLHHLNRSMCTKHLGTGGFANVRLYKCMEIHEKTSGICDEEFVVKQLSHNYDNVYNTQYLLQQYNFKRIIFENEYDIGKQLNHPNLIKTLDFDVQLNCIVFENFIGTDMLDFLNENIKQFDVKQNLKYFDQVLNGVHYMHESGIAHMDIKLENILINNSQNLVKVIDFGYAVKFIRNNSKLLMSQRCGTESYFPPEYYRKGDFECDKVDIWCLGIVLYNLIFDRMPWEYSCRNLSTVFKHFEDYMLKDCLHPGLFDINQIFELQNKDKDILIEIFFGVFCLEPKKRMSIADLQTKFKTLSLLN